MKKPFYPRTTSAGLLRQFHLFPTIIGVVLVVLLFLRLVFPSVFFGIAAPFWKAGDALAHTTDQFFSGFKTKQTLLNQLEAAERERDELLQENKTLSARVIDIEKVVHGGEEKNTIVVAGVIARPPVSPYETLLIAPTPGTTISEQSLVVGPGGVPLGTIASVSGQLAQVRLFSEKGRANEGWVGEAKLPATLIGSGTGSFEATLSGDAKVVAGDPVYLPGPGALFIGNVVKAEVEQTTQKLHILVRSVINPFSITWVGIVPITIPS